MRANAKDATMLLKSMANESRLLILCQLVQGPKCVSELLETLELSQSALSQHLSKLREQQLVKTEKKGLRVYYQIADDKAKRILETLYLIYCH